jgi:hypothetical protein
MMGLWISFHGDDDCTVVELPLIDFSAGASAATNDENSSVDNDVAGLGTKKFKPLFSFLDTPLVSEPLLGTS